MRDLTAACAELADQLSVFTDNDITSDCADAGLLTSGFLVVDEDIEPGNGRRSVPTTRTPGNTQAINAEMDAHQLVRRLEASLRLAVTGHTGKMRGGSDTSTRAAITAIEKLGEAVSPHARQQAARLLDRATTTIGQLPAVDEIPRWEKIRPGPGGMPPMCPNCETYSLRVALSAGVVVCVFPGCEDMDGRKPPQARMDLSKIDGRPVLVWRDGLVQLLLPACDTQPLPPFRAQHRRPFPATLTFPSVRNRCHLLTSSKTRPGPSWDTGRAVQDASRYAFTTSGPLAVNDVNAAVGLAFWLRLHFPSDSFGRLNCIGTTTVPCPTAPANRPVLAPPSTTYVAVIVFLYRQLGPAGFGCAFCPDTTADTTRFPAAVLNVPV